MDSVVGKTINYAFLVSEVRRSLPTLPEILDQLTSMLKDTQSPTFAVKEVMTSDQSISMKILRVANSVYYRGERGRVTDVGEAIGTLGYEKINWIVLTSTIFEMFSNIRGDKSLHPADLWKHSLGVAVASRTIAEISGKCECDQAYTCGLLHDIGKVARLKLDSEAFLNDSRDALEREISLHQAERANGSPLHDRLGQLVCRDWGLSVESQSVVRWHHVISPDHRTEISKKTTHDLIDVVILGNWLTHEMKFGLSGHQSHGSQPTELFERLGLDPNERKSLIKEIQSRHKAMRSFVGLLERKAA